MRVAIVHTDFKIYWSARLNAIQQLLQQNGYELHIIEIASIGSPYSFAEDNNESCENWNVLFEDRAICELSSKEVKSAIYAKLDIMQPDVVIAGAIAFYSGAVSTSWARKRGRKIIIFDDAKISSVPRGKITNYIKKKIYSAVDAVIYPSDDWLETAMYWGFEKDQLFTGIDVVDNDFWISDITKSKKTLLFVGRLIPRKNIVNVIKEFVAIPNNQDSNLIIVGDGEQKQEILNLISDSKSIEYRPFVQQVELRQIYSQVSAFIIPSTYDTWGLVINEAMASGLPIWASSECGATATLVNDGVNGVVFDPFDNGSIKEALQRFVNSDIESLTKMGTASREIIQKWGLPLLAGETLRAVEYVLSVRPRKIDLISRLLLRLWRGRYNQK